MLSAAGDLQVDPVRIDLSPRQQTVAVTVHNNSDKPTSIQIEAVAWSQAGGKDVYAPTRELLVSPPIVTIAPGAEQIIRAALRRQADATLELAYRIYLQELPPAPTPGFMGLHVALRIGLPVFVMPLSGSAAPKMVWTVAPAREDSLKVVLNNQGNAHVQVTDFALLVTGTDKTIAAEAGSSYVLAGQTREWLLKAVISDYQSGGRLRLKAYTDAGAIDMELPLGSP
jgi:fimbrial chaperone protein